MSTQPIEAVTELLEVDHSDLDLSLRVRRSAKLDKILPALIAAQLEFDPIAKDAENEAYKRGGRVSKYATLDSVVTATLPHLNKHGLTILQQLQSDNKSKELIITTSLYHTSEQFFESDLTMPSIGMGARFDPQTVASASTYGRRIAWLAIVGAAPGDDDGNAASGVGSKEAAQEVAKEKIATAAKAGNKTAQKALQRVTTLFYTMPLNHNGNFAEFTNIPAYLSSNEDKQDMLRFAFSANGAKKTKDETTLVPTEKLPTLLQVLAGDCGVDVHVLKAAQ